MYRLYQIRLFKQKPCDLITLLTKVILNECKDWGSCQPHTVNILWKHTTCYESFCRATVSTSLVTNWLKTDFDECLSSGLIDIQIYVWPLSPLIMCMNEYICLVFEYFNIFEYLHFFKFNKVKYKYICTVALTSNKYFYKWTYTWRNV